MVTGEGWISEIYEGNGGASGRLRCEAGLEPAPGQYVMACPSGPGKDPSSLGVPLFAAGRADGGFVFAGSIPENWNPGMRLALRGPLGRGFQPPREARRAVLAALDGSAARLGALIPGLLEQGSAIVLVCKVPFPDLPEAVEVQTLEGLEEVCRWADYMAMDVSREALPDLLYRLRKSIHAAAQVLVRAPMPCGEMAECGACAVQNNRGWKLACKDGPVFDWREIREG